MTEGALLERIVTDELIAHDGQALGQLRSDGHSEPQETVTCDVMSTHVSVMFLAHFPLVPLNLRRPLQDVLL